MGLYRLENNTLIGSPDTIIINGNGILNPTDEQLRLTGYKELKYQDQIDIEWYETINEVYSEDNDYIYINYNVVPKSNLLSLYTERLTTEMNFRLENEFFWSGKCVKLSESNQKDYSGMYTLLSNNKTLIPTFQCNFKNSTPHFFADFDELNDFGVATITFVNNLLIPFRAETYKINNMSNTEIYEYLKLNNI